MPVGTMDRALSITALSANPPVYQFPFFEAVAFQIC